MTETSLIERITRSLAYMLRHRPEQFDLDLDPHGYAPIGDVLHALTERLNERVHREDLEEAVTAGDRQRYEIVGDLVRALYGHSIPVEPGEESEPPELLFLAIPTKDVARAQRFGLRGGRRSFLHLALNPEDAIETGRRLAREYSLITVHALEAFEQGVPFYDRRALFLAEELPTEFLEVGESFDDGEDPERRPGPREGGRDRDRGRGPRGGGGRSAPRSFESRPRDEVEPEHEAEEEVELEEGEEPLLEGRLGGEGGASESADGAKRRRRRRGRRSRREPGEFAAEEPQGHPEAVHGEERFEAAPRESAPSRVPTQSPRAAAGPRDENPGGGWRSRREEPRGNREPAGRAPERAERPPERAPEAQSRGDRDQAPKAGGGWRDGGRSDSPRRERGSWSERAPRDTAEREPRGERPERAPSESAGYGDAPRREGGGERFSGGGGGGGGGRGRDEGPRGGERSFSEEGERPRRGRFDSDERPAERPRGQPPITGRIERAEPRPEAAMPKVRPIEEPAVDDGSFGLGIFGEKRAQESAKKPAKPREERPAPAPKKSAPPPEKSADDFGLGL